ncbi:MAG TPA: hypothetical protein VH110_03260 [Candidatus Acidoferrum sp.]|jgi:hypothetical protein|nr:hypothetical protein [Candidatus Acidoferrum sp.]
MRQTGQPDGPNTNCFWRAGICLFLAVLFSYNPFFTIYGSPAGLHVRHPLSFRGTVASSELRRSITKQAVPKIDAPTEAVLEVPPRPEAFLVEAKSSKKAPLISQQETASEDLWFRPPPIF